MRRGSIYIALIYVLVSLFWLPDGNAQENIPIGTWRTHFSFNQVNHVVQAGQRIYAASSNGLFYFDKQDNSITKITNLDGLQTGNVSALAYDTNSGQLFIGYESGNLDILTNSTIYNVDLTSTSQIQGPKAINHIYFFNAFAYLSTTFGVLKFDIEKREVKETYRELGISQTGQLQALEVHMSTVVRDSLFIATGQGILAANLVEGFNLLDTQNWFRFGPGEGIPVEDTPIIASLDQSIIAGQNSKGLYQYDNGSWVTTGVLTNLNFNTVQPGSNLYVVADFVPYQLSQDLIPVEIVTGVEDRITTLLKDDAGATWLGSLQNGLIGNIGGGFQSYLPSGPAGNEVVYLYYTDDKVYALPGDYSAGVIGLGREGRYYVFKSGQWENTKVNPVEDVVAAAEFNGNVYLASIGFGLLEINSNGDRITYDQTNSPLMSLNPPVTDVRIPAIKASSSGLWVLNYGFNIIHRLDKQGEWRSFTINNTLASFAVDMIEANDLLWLIIDPSVSGGILVFDPETGDSRYLSSATNNGGLASTRVNTLALDKEGFIWAGTDRGVSVFSNPSFVLSGSVDAIEPIFENRQLLRDEVITDIEVDGGDRKWIASERGVWLFDPEADRQIHFFNTQNSPLPDNKIMDVKINHNTGEVFFATQKGMVSWRDSGTEAGEVSKEVEIFPNPVRSDFTGTIGISGIRTNADVKITDSSGKLIWKTRATGNTATWNGRDYRGNKAATGIYFVFSSSDDGEETFIGKIAVIN